MPQVDKQALEGSCRTENVPPTTQKPGQLPGPVAVGLSCTAAALQQVQAAVTPTSYLETGAQISAGVMQQAAAMQPAVSSAALHASTASSCQQTASTNTATLPAHHSLQQQSRPADSGCGWGRKGAGLTDVLSPPQPGAHSAPSKGGGRKRASTASKKRERDDPLTKAIERYMDAKSKEKVSAGGEGASPSYQVQQTQRPRTGGSGCAGSGAQKSGSASGTGGSTISLGPDAAAGQGTTLSLGLTGLQLVGEPSTAAAAAVSTRQTHGAARALVAADEGGGNPSSGNDAAEVQDALGNIAAAGQEATTAVFAPLAMLHQQFGSLQEQLVAGFGEDLGGLLGEVAELGRGGPFGEPELPDSFAPLTAEDFAEARRQLAATAKPFPPGYAYVSAMPLTEEHFGPLGGAPAGSGSNTAGDLAAAPGAAAAPEAETAAARSAPPTSTGKSKSFVAPYRLPVPLRTTAAAQYRRASGGGGGGSSGGRARYPVREARGRRKKDAGYVSFDSADCSAEDEMELDDDDDDDDDDDVDEIDPDDVREADLTDSEASLPSISAGGSRSSYHHHHQQHLAGRQRSRGAAVGVQQHHRQQQQQPAAGDAAAGMQRPRSSDGIIRLTVGLRNSQKPQGTTQQQQQQQQQAAPKGAQSAAARMFKCAAGATAAAAASPAINAGIKGALETTAGTTTATGAAASRGSETPFTASLVPSGLSPLLSPTLANLFLPDQALPGPAAPIDLNADLEHMLGTFDFSNDAVLIGPAASKSGPSSVLANVQASMEAAAAFTGAPVLQLMGQSAAVTGSWPAALAAMTVAVAGAGEGAIGNSGSLLNPPLPPNTTASAGAAGAAAATAQAQPGPPARASSAPALPLVSNTMPAAGAASAPASRLSSAVPSALVGDAGANVVATVAAAAAAATSAPFVRASSQPAGPTVGSEIEEVLGAAAKKELLDRMDLHQVLAVHKTPILGSPLLQGLMSPSALSQLFENW